MPVVINDFDVVVEEEEDDAGGTEVEARRQERRLRPRDVTRIIERDKRRRLRVRAH